MMSELSRYEWYLILGTLIPFAGFWLLLLFGPRLGKPLAGWTAVLAMGASCVLATMTLVGWWGEVADGTAAALTTAAAGHQYHWADIGSVPVNIGVKLDSLTVIMFFMVTFIATWIFVFSVGYMAGHSDEVAGKSKYHRFFCYLCLFGFSMLGLVCSSSLLFLFIFWELVGLCSYLLIGFYFDKKFATDAAMKAFITNRVGDFGFLFGLMMVFFFLGTLDLDEAAVRFAEQFAASTGVFSAGFTIDLFGWELSGGMLATMMGIGLFCGAMGKSAQFPLQVWLPDAMAGPTPVSALIHAATMVAAGVFLVARIFRLLTPEAQMFIAIIGCVTLTLMALVAVVQVDIKKCLAYSTLSQLGYMIFGLGCGAWIAALFHLMTHAFFKAMLFLGSGQVIEGCHHEQDMRKMGGLMRKMPVTGLTFLVGVLAISGFGIPLMHIGLGGYFSKDEILAVSWHKAYRWGQPIEHETHAARSGPGAFDAIAADSHAESDAAAKPPAWASVVGIEAEAPAAPAALERSAGRFRLVQHHAGSDGHASTPDGEHGQANDSGHGSAEEHAGVHSPGNGGRAGSDGLWKVLFWCALITAYVTPFYMMRCWWMTFMGKPRDAHVHEHAHESPLMWFPLVVLAGSTVAASYYVFRPMIAHAATVASGGVMVTGFDGVAEDAAGAHGVLIDVHAAHHWLAWGVGGAWLVSFLVAIVIYGRGLALASRIKQVLAPVAFVLEKKYFFDELYGFLFVSGCRFVAQIARLIDTYVIDLFANLSALVTERFAVFSGRGVDANVVDGVFNGLAVTSFDVSNLARAPQTGRIRNYVLFAAGGAAIAILALLLVSGWQSQPTAVTLLP